MSDKIFKSKIIGGREFKCRKGAARDVLLLKLKLLKIFGGTLEALPPEVFSQGKAAITDDVAIKLFARFLDHIDPATVASTIIDLCEMCYLDGAQVNYDYAFNDGGLDNYRLALWVIEVQFGDFFGALSRSKLGERLSTLTREQSQT